MSLGKKQGSLKLGKRIQKLRKEAGFNSQESFAEALKLSRTHIGHIEQGRKNPSMKVLTKIASVLKIDIKNLF